MVKTNVGRVVALAAGAGFALVVPPFGQEILAVPLTSAATPPTVASPPREATTPLKGAPLSAILAAVKAPGARAVLVNVWATWCEPCREELPGLLRAYGEARGRGLRLVMVAADDVDDATAVTDVLVDALASAGLGSSVDFPAFIKVGDDTEFVNGLDRRWSGALPATFLFDGRGRRVHSWLAPVTYAEVKKQLNELLTVGRGEIRTTPSPNVAPTPRPSSPRRQP